ncbi:hypothetical protein D3C86_1170850 [compost metagenome]
MSLTPVCEAASISMTSMCWPAMMEASWRPWAVKLSDGLSMTSVSLFKARAKRRAVVVLPTPRTPVSMKAWAMRPVAKALVRVLTMASCPIRSSKVRGRYLRARTL